MQDEAETARRGVAIVGAGMAGATAANRLSAAGLPVRVFDKGRGVGGRMATRHGDGLSFDHGAQFMRARGPAFAARLADWERRGIVAPWPDATRRVGTPGMPAPVRDLLAGIPVASGVAITRISRDGSGWRLADESGRDLGPFAAVAITIPAPQALALLDASGHALPGIERAAYSPCWSLMLALDAAPAGGLIEPRDGSVALIASDATKPGRPPGARLTVHATPDWSRAHLEAPPASIVADLGQATAAALGTPFRTRHAVAHRWRYAAVETALGHPCLYDPGNRLGAAGDWCLGPRIEAAHDSGLALAEAILQDAGAPA